MVNFLNNIFNQFFSKNTFSNSNTFVFDESLFIGKEYLIIGHPYNCLKNKKKYRFDVLKKMKLNDPVIIEKYYYKGSPAYMIIDPKTKLDFGVFSAVAAHHISTHYTDNEFEGYLCQRLDDSYKVRIYRKSNNNIV